MTGGESRVRKVRAVDRQEFPGEAVAFQFELKDAELGATGRAIGMDGVEATMVAATRPNRELADAASRVDLAPSGFMGMKRS